LMMIILFSQVATERQSITKFTPFLRLIASHVSH
jgi:hypothetical protein